MGTVLPYGMAKVSSAGGSASAPFIRACTLFCLEVFDHLAHCVCRSASTLPMPALLFRSASAAAVG